MANTDFLGNYLGLKPQFASAVLPEQATASGLNTGANAVGQAPAAPAQPSGLGLKAPPDVAASAPPVGPADTSPLQPVAMDQPPPLSTAPPAANPALQDKTYYDFQNNPIRSIGRAMEAFAAGYQGNPSPVAAWQKQQLEQQAMGFKTADLALQTLSTGQAYLAKLPEDQHGAFIDDFSQRFAPALGGLNLKPILNAFSKGQHDEAAGKLKLLQSLGATPQMLDAMSKAPDAASAFLGELLKAQALQAAKPTPAELKTNAQATREGENAADLAVPKAETFSDQPVAAVNPDTGKPELAKFGSKGTVKFTGVAPPPAKDPVDNLSVPTMIGFTDPADPNGDEKQVAAVYDKTKQLYRDASNGQPIVNPQNLRIIGNATGGGRSIAIAGRVTTAVLDASSDIMNMSELPLGSTMGLFGNLPNTPLSALKRGALTTQAQQDMQSTMAGLSRAMSLLGSGGMQGSDEVMKSFDALQPKLGQTTLTIMRNLGSFRQQAVNGMDAALSSPLYSPQQKKLIQTAKDNVVKAIPWLPHDVTVLEGKGPNATMSSIFSAKLDKSGGSTADATSTKTINGVNYHKVNGQWMQ